MRVLAIFFGGLSFAQGAVPGGLPPEARRAKGGGPSGIHLGTAGDHDSKGIVIRIARSSCSICSFRVDM